MKGNILFLGSRYALIVLKLFAVYIIKNFKITTKLKLEDLKFRMNITLNLINKHMVQIERR